MKKYFNSGDLALIAVLTVIAIATDYSKLSLLDYAIWAIAAVWLIVKIISWVKSK